MLDDDLLNDLKTAVQDCDEARDNLAEALDTAATRDGAASDASVLEPVATALADWRDAQEQFMAAVDASNVSDPPTAALLLKTNHGVDASNARCGIPGTDVDGADQPFPLDLSGEQGMVLTQAATNDLS
ncbi:MAG: hypothetical protein ABEL51_04290 [Salinibacter sp.]